MRSFQPTLLLLAASLCLATQGCIIISIQEWDDDDHVSCGGYECSDPDACAQIGCPTDRSIVIGDGANDLKMLRLAGLSVAYRAKPVVAQQAAQSLNFSPLDGVLAWFD